MHKKLLEKLTAKCKDMGLSTESIQQIAEVASNGLADDATDEDCIYSLKSGPVSHSKMGHPRERTKLIK